MLSFDDSDAAIHIMSSINISVQVLRAQPLHFTYILQGDCLSIIDISQPSLTTHPLRNFAI